MNYNLIFSKEEFKNIICDITDNIINLKNIPKHSNFYKYKDFIIRDTIGPFNFYIKLISYSEISIILNRIPDIDNGLFIELNFFNIIRDELLDKTVSYLKNEPVIIPPIDTNVYLDIPEKNNSIIPMKKPIDKQTDEWLLGFNILFDENKKMYLTTNTLGIFNPDNYKNINIEKYELEIFDDFFSDKKDINFEIDELGNKINKLYYEFEIDYIYKINFMYKDKFYSLCYIYNQPTFYYSSLNHIKKALTGKGLDFIGDDFDLKLKIWQLSNTAHTRAGLIKSYQVPMHQKSFLSEFIALRVCYDCLKDIINNISFDNKEFAKQTKLTSITITDFSSSLFGKTPYEILINTYKEYYKELKSFENKIEDIFYNTLLDDSKISFISTNSVIKNNRKTFSERW